MVPSLVTPHRSPGDEVVLGDGDDDGGRGAAGVGQGAGAEQPVADLLQRVVHAWGVVAGVGFVDRAAVVEDQGLRTRLGQGPEDGGRAWRRRLPVSRPSREYMPSRSGRSVRWRRSRLSAPRGAGCRRGRCGRRPAGRGAGAPWGRTSTRTGRAAGRPRGGRRGRSRGGRRCRGRGGRCRPARGRCARHAGRRPARAWSVRAVAVRVTCSGSASAARTRRRGFAGGQAERPAERGR